MTSEDNNTKAKEEKDKGNAAYKNKDFETAHKHYDAAILLDPTNITFYTNKAAAYFEDNKFKECIETCEKAVEVGRENRADYKLIAKAFCRMGHAYSKLEDYREALAYYDKSLSEFRDANVVRTRNEVEKTMMEKERLAYIDPAKAHQEKEKGNQLFRSGKYPEAVKHYSEAIKRNPKDAKLYSNRAACYTKLMEFQLALADCDHCIKLDPKFIKGYIRKGFTFLALKEPVKAARAFEDALELEPNNKEAEDGFKQARLAGFGANTEEAKKRALENPEVQKILSDPTMRLILEQMQNDPGALKEHLSNPEIAEKLQTLLEAGVIGFR